MGFGLDAVSGTSFERDCVVLQPGGENVSGENVLIGLLGRITEVHSTAIDRIFRACGWNRGLASAAGKIIPRIAHSVVDAFLVLRQHSP